MISPKTISHHPSVRGFTLIEILLASAIFAMLIAALYTVYYGTMRLRESTFKKVETGLPVVYTESIIHRDLSAAVPSAGLLAGTFIGTSTTENSTRMDKLEFCAASGRVTNDKPWGDIQKVAYYLADPTETETQRTKSTTTTTASSKKQQDLVRTVTRNLLASVAEEPAEEHLLRNVESLQITYYDGTSWVDSWDSTAQNNKLPSAVKISIGFPLPETDSTNETDESVKSNEAKQLPAIELYCELVNQPRQIQGSVSASGGRAGATGS